MQAFLCFRRHTVRQFIEAGHAVDIGMNLVFITRDFPYFNHFTQNHA